MTLTSLRVIPTGPVHGALRAPASKSVTNRLLVMAALADGVSTLRGPLDSEDSRAMRDCVRALGAEVHEVVGEHAESTMSDDRAVDGNAVGDLGGTRATEVWRITGTAGAPRTPGTGLDARLSGTTARFVTALLTLTAGGGVVDGRGPLRRRPIAPLAAALTSLGASVETSGDGLPVTVAGGGLSGGQVDVDVSESSQFASAVLLAAPYARDDVRLTLHGRSADDYIALTAASMGAWGADVTRGDPGRWHVRARCGYAPRQVDVEYDASAAAHLFALGIASGGAVTVTNAAERSHQPDARLPEVFARMGAVVSRSGTAVTVTAGDRLRAVDVSLAVMPDMVTIIAVLAALAPGTSLLRDVGVARLHETDRLAALTTELGKVGVKVEAQPDALLVHGGTAQGPAHLETYDDHRLAMAFAALGTRVDGITIDDPACVAKTYPHFWSDMARLGARWEEQP